jgi:hypothetical protein
MMPSWCAGSFKQVDCSLQSYCLTLLVTACTAVLHCIRTDALGNSAAVCGEINVGVDSAAATVAEQPQSQICVQGRLLLLGYLAC